MSAFLRRDYLIIRSYRFPFVLDTFFGLLQLAVFFFISETFGNVRTADLGGAPDYFSFAAVGIVISLVVDSASQGLASTVRAEQLSGSLEALMALPLRAAQLCAGLTAFPFAFAAVRAALYLVVAGLWMGLDLERMNLLGIGVMFLLTALAMSVVGVLAGAVVLVFKRGEILAGVAIFGMTILSGAFFPVSELPGALRAVGEVLPFRFALEGIREALFRGRGWEGDAVALAGFSAVGLPVGVALFGQAIAATRRAGTLGQY